MKKLLILSLLTLFSSTIFAQGKSGSGMADEFYQSGRIYVVIATISIIFVGLAIYLFAIDRRLKKIEKGN
jgi:CcmD family protein